MEIRNSRLAERFAEDFDILIRLFGSNAVLTEICSDYLSLCAMTPSDAMEQMQISETLEGLEVEIAKHLNDAKTSKAMPAERDPINKAKRNPK